MIIIWLKKAKKRQYFGIVPHFCRLQYKKDQPMNAMMTLVAVLLAYVSFVGRNSLIEVLF